MANEQDKTKVLYDAVSKDYNIGTFDEFKSKLQDENKRKAFYDGVGKEYDLGTYDEFSAKVSPVKKKEPAQPSTGSLGFSQYLQEKPTPTTTIPYRPGAKERLDVQKELEPQIKKQKEVIRVTELLQKPLPYQQQNLPDFNLNKPIKNPIELKVNKINNGIELNKLRALEGKKNFLDKRTELDVEMSKLQSLKNDYDKADNDVTREGLFKQYNIALESAKAKEAELSQLKTEIDNTEITAKKLEKGLVAIKSMSDEKNSALVNSMNNFYNNTIPSLAKGIGYTIGAAADLAQMGGAGNLPATTDSKTAGDYVRQFSDRLTDEMFANVDDEFKNKSIFDKDENGEYSNLKSPTAWANFITATSGQLLTTAIGGGLGGSTVARATGMFTAMPDIYEGAKEAGLNNQEAALFSIPVALTVGAFEEGGAAPFIIKGAKKAFSKQLGIEMASKVAGKEVTPELIQKVFGEAYQTALDKTTSKFGNIITDALPEAGGEAAEQALQGLAEMGYDATFGKGKERGKGAFGTTFKDVIVQSGEAGVGGFVAATPFSSIKNLSTSQKTEFVNLVKDASNDKEVYNSVIEGLDELKANNEINQGQYNQYVKRFNDMVSLNTKIPPAIDGEARLDAMELVKRKDELVEQKKVVDSSFYEQIDNQISDIDTKLKELATQPTKPVTPPTAEVTLPEVEVVAEKPAPTEPIEAKPIPVENPKVVITGTRNGMENLESNNWMEREDGRIADARGKQFDENGMRIEKDNKGNNILHIKVDATDNFNRSGYLQASVIVPEGVDINKEAIKKVVDSEVEKIKAKNNANLNLGKVQQSDFTSLKDAVVNELKSPKEVVAEPLKDVESTAKALREVDEKEPSKKNLIINDRPQEVYALSIGIKPDNLDYLGKGEFGEAYSTKDGKVIKITSSANEAEIAKNLVGKRGNHAEIYDVKKVGDRFVIYQEELNVDSEIEDNLQSVENILSEQGLPIQYLGNIDYEALSQESKDEYDRLSSFISDLEDINRLYRSLGIEASDLQSGNLGYDKNGKLKAFDLQDKLSKTKAKDVDIDSLKSKSEAISEAYHKAKADGSNPELVKAVEDLLGKPTEVAPEVKATEAEAKVEEAAQEGEKKKTTKVSDFLRKNLKTKPIVFKDKDGNEIILEKQGFDWDGMVDKVADLIDKGYEVALAVKEYLKSQDWFKSLNKDQQDAIIEKSITDFETSIKEAEKGVKEFTKEVAKTIKDLNNNIDKLKQKVTDAKSRIESIKEQGKKIKEWINANRKELKGLTDAQFINLSKKLTNANLQSDINDVMDYLNKMVSNADYNNKLSQAKKLNKDLKKLAKAESTLVNEKEALKRFTSIPPSSSWDIDKLNKYNEFADKLIKSVAPSKNDKGEVINATKDIPTTEIDARAEKLAKEQEQDTFDRLMKNDMFEKIGDSWYWMGQGKPLTVDDIDEIKKELAIVNGKDIKESEAAIDRLNERAEFKEAMKQIVSVQIDKVRNLDRSQFSKEDNEILDRLKYIDVNKLDTKTLIQFNNVLNNIETNGDFSGAGRTIDVEAKLQEANPKLKSIVDKLNLFQYKNTTFWKTIRTKRSFDAIMQRLTLKDAVARAKMNVAMGDESLSANQVRVKKFVDTVNKAREEYIKKNKPSPKDVYSNGLVSRLIQNTGITEKEKAEQFAKRKEELKASIASLKDPKKATEEEQQLGKLIEEIYNELDLDNINNQKELIDKYSQVNKSGMDYILDMVDIYKGVREDFRRSQELYNNTTFDDIEYYTPTQNTTLSYKVSEKESIEGDSDYSGSEFGINTAMSKSSVKRVGMNKANQYMNLDFDNVISKKANDIANQAYTLGDRVFIDKLLKSEEFVETFGAKNAEVLKAAFKAKIDLILNKYPKQSDISKATNILNKISQLGAIRAIGGAFQSVKQSVVLVNTALELTTKGDGDLIGKAMIARYRSKSNGLGKLIEKSPIIMRETTKGGTAIPVDINEVTKTKIENEISRLQKLYGITEEKATQLATYLLKKGDIVPAEISWTAYYMQYLRNEKGVDVDNIDWDAEAANPDKEARAYAEGMVSDKQNVSNPANVSQMIASKEGFYQLMRNLVAPLSSFSFNVRNRLNDNIVALRYGGDRKAAVRDIIATSAELYAFQLLTQSIYAFVLKPGAEYVSEFFGFDPEKDPRDWEDILADITKRTAVFSAIADYLFTGTTIYGEEFGKRALNFIYSAYNKNIYEAEKYFSYSTEEMQQYNKDAQDYERTLPFRQKDISEVISGGGTMGVILGQGVNAFDALSYVYDDTQRMERSAEYNVKKGEYKPEIGRTVPLTEKEKNFFIISGLISAFGALVPVFSELNTINRMALRRGLRQSQTKYGKFSAKEGEEKKMTEFYTAYQKTLAEYEKVRKDTKMTMQEKGKLLKELGEKLDRFEKQRAGGQEVRPNK